MSKLICHLLLVFCIGGVSYSVVMEQVIGLIAVYTFHAMSIKMIMMIRFLFPTQLCKIKYWLKVCYSSASLLQILLQINIADADPGLPRLGGANPGGGVRQPIIYLAIFSLKTARK